MQDIFTEQFQNIPGAANVRRVALMPFTPSWKDELYEHLIEWRWGKYEKELNTLLHAIARRRHPEFYRKRPTPEVIATMRLLKHTDQNAVIMAYNTETKNLTFTTDSISKKDKSRYVYTADLLPFGISNAFAKLTEHRPAQFELDDQKWRAAGMPARDSSFYYCKECKEAQRDHEIIVIPGPPAANTGRHCIKGEATHFNQCTGCLAVAGPNVWA